MFKKTVAGVGFLIWMIVVGTSAKADELDQLRRQVENQYNELIKVQNRLLELEAAQKQQGTLVQQLESRTPNGTFTVPETLKWIENIKFYGDFRYRFEHIDWDENDGTNEESDRHRIRARLGMKAKINDEFAFDLRLATGSSDPVSTNQTLGDEDEREFGSREIWLDRAYVTYTPASIEGLSVLAGKFGTPFYRPGGSQLIWDDDLSPEGIALKYTRPLSANTSAFANAAYLQVEENQSGDYGLELFGVQGGMAHVFDDSALTYGIGYFEYANTQGHAALGNGFEGNSNTGGVYDYDYELVEVFGDYTTQIGTLPVAVYGDYIVNTASGVSEDTGWALGTTLGKAKEIGSSQVGYLYMDMDADSTVGTFNDSDFIGGGTGGRGHKFSYKYQLAKNTQLGATYFCTERSLGDDNQKDDSYRRLQLDFIVKF